MLRRSLATFVAAALVQTIFLVQSAPAASKSAKVAKLAVQVRQKLSGFGVGENARLAVKLKNKEIVGGYVESIGEESFVLKNLKTGESTTIPYTEVTQARGHNLSTGAKIAIGIGIGVAAVLIVLAIWIKCCTG